MMSRRQEQQDELERLRRDSRILHDARVTLTAWHRARIPSLTPLEVIDLLSGRRPVENLSMTEPPEDGTPAAPPHPREDERDPLTGCLPVTAES